MTDKRILFITHDIGLYGASQSLQLLLKNLKGYHVDLVIPKQIYSFRRMMLNRAVFNKHDEMAIREKFGHQIGTIHQIVMDCDWWCFKASLHTKKKNIYAVLEYLFAIYGKWYLRYVLMRQTFDAVHLNSTVLHNYIGLKSGQKFLIHIREEVAQPNPINFISNYQAFDGAIFIDSSTLNSLSCAQSIKHSIIMNPFDMTDIDRFGKPDINIDFSNNIVFAMIGQMNDVKGAAFVVETFVQAKLSNAVLLIVGNGEKGYRESCRKIAGESPQIYFFPEDSNVKQYYAVADYIIRAEISLGLGRTIYEALYSGCGVLVPGDNEQISESFFEYDRLKGKIIGYVPRDSKSLTEALASAVRKKETDFKPLSNIDVYTKNFIRFVSEL